MPVKIWLLKDKMKVEMRFLRAVKGCSRQDRIHNTAIREELRIFSINDKLREYRQGWLNHLDRMDDNRIPRMALQYKPKGRRRIGRPKTRWKVE